jgi:Domain of unknown function (DUF397)
MTNLCDTEFRRSSFCGNGSCVEVSALDNGTVLVRDSKDLTVPYHTYTNNEWMDFVRGVKSGEFDFGLAPDLVGSSSQH